MIKKLDKLILRAFTGPFIVTFFIAFFVLMMQTLWKYIDDLVGKGLDFVTIGKFLWYASASLLTLTMPIAILISSIMTFGNLGESFELVAIKSSGISLLRFMRPLMFFSLLLCGITFMFANYIIPYANLRFKTIYYDISYKKPAFNLKEGTFFTDIPGYAIKIGKKDKDEKTIHDVLIYEQQNPLQDNSIIAEKGVMNTSDDKRYLEFTLENGTRYQEQGNYGDTNTEFIRLQFREYKKLFDLSSLQMMNTPDSLFKADNKMLSVRQLGQSIDSFKKINKSFDNRIGRQIDNTLQYARISDSTWSKVKMPSVAPKKMSDIIPDSAEAVVYNQGLYVANDLRNILEFSQQEYQGNEENLQDSQIEWHRKYSLSLACLVLFFIGAPLGSIIRKGGFGLPLVFAVLFFLIFHLLNMFGEKFAKSGLVSPFTGMWLSVIVLTPVGIFLTYKAMHDSQLLNKEYYARVFKKIRAKLMAGNKLVTNDIVTR